MNEIICYDAQGYPLEFLTQWDQNQVIVVRGIELSPAPVVRFGNMLSKVSLVVKPSINEDALWVDVPNILLTQHSPIAVHLNYEYEDGSSKTRYVFNIPVVPCKQPEDYYMAENIDYVSWVEMRDSAYELILQLENERMVVEVGSTEPDDSDVLWFDTSVAVSE